LVFTIAISFVITDAVYAQGIGLKGGLNMGKFTGEDVSDISDELDEKYHMGYSAGIFMSIPFGEMFSLRPEVLYTSNGAQYEGAEERVMSMNMNWINIPVLAVFNMGPIKVFVGPYFDFFLNGKVKLEGSYGGQTFDEETDIESENISSFVYGAIAGVGIGVGNTIDIEVRYSQGLSTLDREPDHWDSRLGDYEKSDYKPSMIQVLLNFYITK